MRDLTELMDHYREVARTTWNAGFWSQPELRNRNAWEHFQQIKTQLFGALVLAQLEEFSGCCTNLSVMVPPILRVAPVGAEPVPILIERPRDGDKNRYWDDPVNRIAASDAELDFLDYFDWNDMGDVDFQYYRVRIAAFPSQVRLTGRHALIEHRYARVLLP